MEVLLCDIETSVNSTCKIVKCLVVLHDIVIEKNHMDASLFKQIEDKLDENEKREVRTGRKYNRSSVAAEKLRDGLREYFQSDEGSVPWQEPYIKYR